MHKNEIKKQEITFRKVTAADSKALQRVQEIYLYSFPLEEREAWEDILEELKASNEQRRCELLVATQDDLILGFALYTYHIDYKVGYLSYFAIGEAYRSAGIGSLLFNAILDTLQADAALAGNKHSPIGLCWEVENPSFATDEAEENIRNKRIRFYQRNAGILLDQINYQVPPLAPGLATVNYHLMFQPVDDKQKLDQQLYLKIIKVCLLDNYGLSEEHPYFKAAYNSIPV